MKITDTDIESGTKDHMSIQQKTNRFFAKIYLLVGGTVY